MAESTEGISLKLFVGTHLTPDLKELLDKSPEWKQEKIVKETALTETTHEKKPYIGRYISEDHCRISTLRHAENEVRDLLQQYCPKKNCNTLKVVIFPQIFLC